MTVYLPGDVRVNENTALSALHTAYHRYHNFIVEGLRSINPHWSEERLFQVNNSYCASQAIIIKTIIYLEIALNVSV